MKNIFFIGFTLIFLSSFSQKKIYGKVTDENNSPLEGASVYINNTTIGNSTDTNGEFVLNVKEGAHELIISYISYKTIRYSLNTNSFVEPLLFKLKPEDNLLNEVVLKKPKYDEEWKSNLVIFKRAFFGKTKMAEECDIINPKVLYFEFNRKTGELTAEVKEPLIIKHKGLGYLITFDLVEFSLKNNRLFFSGYTRYSNLKKSIRKKWKRNRLEAFNGSQMHFLRSLTSKQLKKNGFIVNQFRRELNPERPSEKEIKFAKELIQLQGNTISTLKKTKPPLTQLDSALVIMENSKKPKYIDYLYKRNISEEHMYSSNKNVSFLDFENYLTVIYTKEPEEENYLIGMFGKRKKAIGMQTSNIVLINGKSMIDKSGVLVNPKAIYVEGYWGFESFANMLPTDYQTNKN